MSFLHHSPLLFFFLFFLSFFFWSLSLFLGILYIYIQGYDLQNFVCLKLNPCYSCWGIGRQQGSAISVCHGIKSVTVSTKGTFTAPPIWWIVPVYFEVSLSFDSIFRIPSLNMLDHAGIVCLFVGWLVAYRPSNMRVYLSDGSAQTILRTATLR